MDMRKENVSKKRKLSHVVAENYNNNNNDDDDGNEEEQKIEKFYALIRSMREARDRLIKGPTSSDDQATRTDHHLLQAENMKPNSQSWKPSFEREDFIPSNANNDREVLTSNFKVPKAKRSSLTTTFLGTSSSSTAKICSRDSAPDHDLHHQNQVRHTNNVQNQVRHTNNVSSKGPLDLSLSL
ncbi:uncharacterized protein LOC133790549 [Humulus lupulus]|uniref:uncharacterized protein LOC133790549 n=1 Tax=Humulus lupulus TaxID=3486 RepID=UPI002B403751|nr:uncharacterized protein LOC133790549 [Humulus lupulus]